MVNVQTDIPELVEKLREIGSDTQDCEVKEAVRKLPESLPETISAFANKEGGIIILGLSEKSNFTPVEGFDAKKIFSALMEAGDVMTPPVRMKIDMVPFENAQIVVAQVPAVDLEERPCYITGKGAYVGSFIRTGDGDRRLTRYEVDRFKEMRGQPKYDLEPVLEATQEDLDTSVLRAVAEQSRLRTPRFFGKMKDEEILVKLGALVRIGEELHPTLAGLLIAGRYPQQFFPRLCVNFTVYPGVSKFQKPGQPYRYLDSKTLDGSISDMLMDAVAMLQRNMRTAGRIEGVLREDVADYPLVAFREALVNALQHRDYSPEGRGSQVQINMFADRLEILNPGGLFGAANLDDRSAGVSATRNQNLSRLLEYAPNHDGVGGGFVIENKGTGLIQIRESLAAENLPPAQIQDWISAFDVVFTKRMATATAPQSVWNDFEAALRRLLTEKQTISTAEIMKLSGLSRKTITTKLGQLVRRGIVQTTEPERSPKQRYRLAETQRH